MPTFDVTYTWTAQNRRRHVLQRDNVFTVRIEARDEEQALERALQQQIDLALIPTDTHKLTLRNRVAQVR